MKARKPRSHEELRAAMAHISYEWQAFGSASIAVIKASNPGQPHEVLMRTQLPLVRPALLDSLAIHARTLLHFVYPRDERADDVLARDFIPDWDALRPAEPADLETFRKRVNKLIAHLTYDRIAVTESESASWFVPGLLEALTAAWNVFVAKLPEELKDPPGPPVQYDAGGLPMVGIPRWPTLK
jgi:hypothetical protein